MVTLESLGGIMINTQARNAKDVSLSLALGAIFPISTTPMTLVAMTWILYDTLTDWLRNLP